MSTKKETNSNSRLEKLEEFKKAAFGNKWIAVDLVIREDAVCTVSNPTAIKVVRDALRTETDRQIEEEKAKVAK